MPQYNSINTFLKIQDKNIRFHQNAWESKKIQGVEVLVFYATLTYSVDTCPSYGGNMPVIPVNLQKHEIANVLEDRRKEQLNQLTKTLK